MTAPLLQEGIMMRRPTWKEYLSLSLPWVGIIVFVWGYPKIRENMPVGDSIETCWRFPDECNKLHPEEYETNVARIRKEKTEMDNDDKACEVLEKSTDGRRLCEVENTNDYERPYP